jgi:superoxide dismutase
MSNSTQGMSQLKAENAELIEKLMSTLADSEAQEDALREINFSLRSKLIKQQKASGEPVDSVGLSPKQRSQFQAVFNKFADGNVLKSADLKKLTEEMAEPFTDEEIEEGIKQMDKDGNGVIDFEEFCKWMQEEREKEEHQGLKMQMLKMKMRAAQFKSQVEQGLVKTPSLPADYQGLPENLCRITNTISQGSFSEAKTQIHVEYAATPADAGLARMAEVGAPGDAKACLCASIAMLDGTEGCNEELQAIYEQVFDMATEGGKLLEEKGDEVFLLGQPTVRVVVQDGKPVLQVLVCFSQDPFTDYLNVDSRYVKTLEGSVNWGHTVDEVLKEEGEEIDLMALEGLQSSVKVEADRAVLEWLAASPELSEQLNESPEAAQLLAAALCFGNVDVQSNVRSVTDMINPTIAESLPSFGEFIEMVEDRRRIPAEMIGGITEKMVEMYCRMPDPVKNIYGELKSKIAGPLRVDAVTPTAQLTVTSAGLDCVHKFFPTVEEIEAHPSYENCDGSEEDIEW